MGAQCCNNQQYSEDVEPCDDTELNHLNALQINIKYHYTKKKKEMNSSQTTKTQERTKQLAVRRIFRRLGWEQKRRIWNIKMTRWFRI